MMKTASHAWLVRIAAVAASSFVAVVLAASAPATAGAIAGKVTFDGTPPAPRPITITKDEAVCGRTPLFDESLVVGPGGGVKNTLVRIVDAGDAPPLPAPTPNATIDQNGCRFVPRVRIVPAGAPVDIVNSDGILHNIRTWSKDNPSFNRAQPKFKKVLTETFHKPEIFRIACDVHSWMKGWVVVAANAYNVLSDETGAFELKDVPAGTYTVEFWHEALGSQTRKVTVPATGTASVDLAFKAPQR
jgi:plastocyanin